ncbi:MAG: hypothetical protein ACFE0Q_00515 [Anaerolineae bacterium]
MKKKTKIFTLQPLFTMVAAIFGIIILLLIIILGYCEGFVETDQFLKENNLHNMTAVQEFLIQNLEIGTDNIEIIQDFILEKNMDCSDVLSNTDPVRFEESESDNLIACIFPAHDPSFLNIKNFVWGKLNVCYADPHLRIIFFFRDGVVIDIFDELLLTGL